ncbi:MAG: hypothetical protein HOM20_11845 [Porticoccaceae bacterium]|jgi:hypothetical protein|nr:hypothetical protein [Porticoccaceae bacterium]
MEKIARIAEKERAEIFQATADQLGMVPAAIEKDFWVCWGIIVGRVRFLQR